MPEFLALMAALVQPNSPALAPVLDYAAGHLNALCGSQSFSGYQRGGKRHVWHMLTAIHNALSTECHIACIDPPPSFQGSGQKIRLVADTLSERRGTCIDLAILQASLWERIGLYPCLILVPGHALLACWQTPHHSVQPVVRLGASDVAAKAMRQALEDGTLVAVNSVEVAVRQSFEQAAGNGRAIIDKVLREGGAVEVIDLRAARHVVTPLP